MTRRGFLAAPRPTPLDTNRHWLRVHRRAMACRFEITLDAKDARFIPAAQSALNEIDAIEAQLTVFRETSALVHINQHAAAENVRCEPGLFNLLTRCQQLATMTDGAFDITSTPLSRCWGFVRRAGRLPSTQEIRSSRALVGMSKVILDHQQSSVKFRRPGIELNLGAVGKGYALDCVASNLRRAGVQHALLSAGQSSLLAIGGRERGWSVDLVSPRRAQRIARVWLRDAAIGTSGTGEQFFLVDGHRYGHVLDPRSGWPAEGVLSASAVCSSAADADALSTAFLVAGPTLAHRYSDKHPQTLAVITLEDDSVGTFVIGDHVGAEIER